MADAAPQPDPAVPHVFVSYASADRERVMSVVAALRGAGVTVWLDRQGIAGGENYAAEINAAIQRCAVLMLMCSAASLASRNVKQEIALGLGIRATFCAAAGSGDDSGGREILADRRAGKERRTRHGRSCARVCPMAH